MNLLKLFTHRNEPGKTPVEHGDLDEEIPRYPPFAKGLPVPSVEKLLGTQKELIERIRGTLGLPTDQFNKLVRPVIQQYAAFVHLLPASEAHHHRGAGGLFRHGLEVAFWATQASEAVIFSIEGTPKEKRDNEPRWRLATLIAALLHDVGKPLSDVSVTDRSGSVTWDPYAESLVEWAARHNVDRYFIHWQDSRHKRHEQFSLLVIERIVPREILGYLAKPGPMIMKAMLEAISGVSSTQPITRLKNQADQNSVKKDLKENRLSVDEFSYGVPVERYVFDAIRRLVKTGKWKTNEPGAKVWRLNQGVFIQWRQIGDLYEIITQDKIPGIPRDPDTLADILIERGFALPNRQKTEGEQIYYRYWEVLPELLQKNGEIKLLMLRLESDSLVFTSEPPAAVGGVVVGETEALDTASGVEKASGESDARDQEKRRPDAAEKPGAIEEKDAVPEKTTADDDSADNDGDPLQPLLALGQGLGMNMPAPGKEESVVASAATEATTETGEKSREGKPVKHKKEKTSERKEPKQGINRAANPDTESVKNKEVPTEQTLPAEDPAKALKAGIDSCGKAAPILRQIILPVLEGTAPFGKTLCIIDGKVGIPYPGGLPEGKGMEILNALQQGGAIVSDPVLGGKVRDLKGIKVVVLTDALAVPIKKLFKKDPTPGKTVSNRQNVAKLPRKKEIPAASNPEPSPKVKPSDLTGFRQPDLLEEAEKTAKRNAEKVSMEGLLPATITPVTALQQLKEMMQKREGDWLVGPVTVEGDCLVTSDKAFDEISKKYAISKHVLRGLLHGGQRKPFLRIKQQKLYLQMEAN